jgi:hypothetical protein
MATVLILDNPNFADTYTDRLKWRGIEVISELPLRLNRKTPYLVKHGDYSRPADEVLAKIREITANGTVDFVIVGWEGWWKKVEAIDRSMLDRTLVTYFELYPRKLFLEAGITLMRELNEVLRYLDELAAELILGLSQKEETSG